MDLGALLDLDRLVAQLILAVGAAMLLGNGFAIFQDRRGRGPARAAGPFRPGRAWWLLGVGGFITAWAAASMLIS